MTRMSKKGERRNMSPRRPRIAGKKTGAKKDNLPKGFREHPNALEAVTAEAASSQPFIPKIR